MNTGIAELVATWVTLPGEAQRFYLDLFNRASSFLGHPELFQTNDICNVGNQDAAPAKKK